MNFQIGDPVTISGNAGVIVDYRPADDADNESPSFYTVALTDSGETITEPDFKIEARSEEDDDNDTPDTNDILKGSPV